MPEPKKPKTNSAERKKIKAEFDKAQEELAAKTKMRKEARDKKKAELRAKKAANKAFSQQQFAELKNEIIANRNARKKGGSNPLKLKGLNTGGVV
tara:strand:+ start:2621 stop:2905 length:285 start_codon:yes stop_codon:yes gene_type:complete